MRTKIKKINLESLPILVFGGVYSNLQALESLLQEAEKRKILSTQLFCTGDILGYCAQPEEVLEIFQTNGIHSIAGNVEIQLRNDKSDCGCDFNTGSRCDIFSKQWYPFTQKKISKKSFNYLHTLPEFIKLEYKHHKIGIVHGSYFNTSEFIFKSTPWQQKEKIVEAMNVSTVIAGHCGLPFLDKVNEQVWFNPGVIGMPANDGTPRVWFGTISESESLELNFEFHSLCYDYKKTSDLMKDNHLPEAYSKTLLNGIWDNCDILPVQEANLQGIAMDKFCMLKNSGL
ncbi:MAG: metallophosphoesterase family protein [Bacteroidetes bacterium]|nr:metallophosphoesterase family protein [Bacteroidota bacterium]NCQ10971.1 metallophosphoesterase family protein [Bacteroidota bacterium]